MQYYLQSINDSLVELATTMQLRLCNVPVVSKNGTSIFGN
jgi:hypothetical protein